MRRKTKRVSASCEKKAVGLSRRDVSGIPSFRVGGIKSAAWHRDAEVFLGWRGTPRYAFFVYGVLAPPQYEGRLRRMGAGSCNGHSLTPGFEAALEREGLESRGRSLGLRTIYVIDVRNEKKKKKRSLIQMQLESRWRSEDGRWLTLEQQVEAMGSELVTSNGKDNFGELSVVGKAGRRSWDTDEIEVGSSLPVQVRTTTDF